MVATRRLTVEEFEKMPLEGWELIDGDPVEIRQRPTGPRYRARYLFLIGSHVYARPTGATL